MAYGASISPAEREWLFFSALRRIENSERMAKQDRITEPNGPAED